MKRWRNNENFLWIEKDLILVFSNLNLFTHKYKLIL